MTDADKSHNHINQKSVMSVCYCNKKKKEEDIFQKRRQSIETGNDLAVITEQLKVDTEHNGNQFGGLVHESTMFTTPYILTRKLGNLPLHPCRMTELDRLTSTGFEAWTKLGHPLV